MVRRVRHFPDDRNGTAAIEYSLVATLIALAIIVAITGAADEVVAMWNSNSDKIGEAFR